MSYNPNPNNPNPSLELTGIERMRSGVMFFILVPLLSFLAVFLILTIVGPIILDIVALVLAILGYLKIREGFSLLVQAGKPVGSGSTGMTLILVGIILGIVGAILTLDIVGIFLLPIAGLLDFIGFVLFGIGLYKVGSTYNNTLTKVGGILVATLIIGFIGLILVFIGLGEIKKNFGTYGYAGQMPMGQSQTTQALSQVGTGTLRGGVGTFTVYSSQQVVVYSAQILGTQYYSNSINPNTLSPGINNITIVFGNLSGLELAKYTVRLTLSNGQSLDLIAYNQG